MMLAKLMCSYLQAVVNSGGLVFDIVGAWLVAWEVVNQFHGEKLTRSVGIPVSSVVVSRRPVETGEYKTWEIKKL